ncbi:UPF0389 protein CG9231 [Epargyreus clarus]|uniref:UPF0389 protein CG9231 n=1 Tax=Epargyreus clarus TaxID=520877 RepID=UPI003C2FDAE1
MNKLFPPRFYAALLRRNMATVPSGPKVNPEGGPMSPKYRPSDFQKFILVWTKKYKSKQEIPEFVSPDLIERSRSEARIKISNILILLTILGSMTAVWLGKSAAKRGESVHQMNLDWHKKYDEEYAKKQAAASK